MEQLQEFNNLFVGDQSNQEKTAEEFKDWPKRVQGILNKRWYGLLEMIEVVSTDKVSTT
jgi:hypothetical protein